MTTTDSGSTSNNQATNSPAQQSSVNSVFYVALGDSLTHGMESAGVAYLSQQYSFPKLIADYLNVERFTQPILKGWTLDNPPKGAPQDNRAWFGNPPNIELVLRAADHSLNNAGNPAKLPIIGGLTQFLNRIYDAIKDSNKIIADAGAEYLNTLEDRNYDAYIYEQPAIVNGEEYYQNLGVFAFTVQDISNTMYDSAQLKQQAHNMRDQINMLAEKVFSNLTGKWNDLFHTHPGLLPALIEVFLRARSQKVVDAFLQERNYYVLRRPGLTALQAMQNQQPHIVTLLIGANEFIPAMQQGFFDSNKQPIETKTGVFEKELGELVPKILDTPSMPYLFLATIPSPTAGPDLVRNRLGLWSPFFPMGRQLTEADIFYGEAVIAKYNEIIRNLVTKLNENEKYKNRIWLVDIFKMQARILRATRQDAEAARRAVGHAVRIGLLQQNQVQAVLDAVRAGNLDTIEYLRSIESKLLTRRLREVDDLPDKDLGAHLGEARYTQQPGDASVDAFVVKLQSGRSYRLTGEYVHAEAMPGQPPSIAQGGAISLDALHPSSTAYAYIAREFLNVIYQADKETQGDVLKPLNGKSPPAAADFDKKILEVAVNDTLLNDVPTLATPFNDLLTVLDVVLQEQAPELLQ